MPAPRLALASTDHQLLASAHDPRPSSKKNRHGFSPYLGRPTCSLSAPVDTFNMYFSIIRHKSTYRTNRHSDISISSNCQKGSVRSQRAFPKGLLKEPSQRAFPKGLPKGPSQRAVPKGLPKGPSQRAFPTGPSFPKGLPKGPSQRAFPKGRPKGTFFARSASGDLLDCLRRRRRRRMIELRHCCSRAARAELY